jgi:hypothetical protein
MTQFRTLPIAGADNRAVADVVRGLMDGKSNNTGSVTLATGGATTTTINDERIGYGSIIVFMPLASTSASILSSLYISNRTQGTATVTHPANTTANVLFGYVVVG